MKSKGGKYLILKQLILELVQDKNKNLKFKIIRGGIQKMKILGKNYEFKVNG